METPREAGRKVTKPQTLRQQLRKATAVLHDRLDRAMRPPEDWRSREEYARFLSSQYQARIAIEGWLADYAPTNLKPPEQTPLLGSDLAELGEAVPASSFAFSLENDGHAAAVGAAWVLAGSSLGNRAMLHDMRRTLPEDAHWPAAFLGGTDMTEFWQSLRPLIEVPASDEELDMAERAASHVFDHFLTVAETTRPQDAVAM